VGDVVLGDRVVGVVVLGDNVRISVEDVLLGDEVTVTTMRILTNSTAITV